MRRAALALAFIASAGCASTGRTAVGELGEPEMLSKLQPELRLGRTDRAPSATGRASNFVKIEVVIDSIGNPMMSTLKLIGPVSSENRDALARWIAESKFRPAQRDGHAVAGIYRSTIKLENSRRAR